MANKITIPKLGSSVSPLRLPEIDAERNPYESVERAAAVLTDALEKRDERRAREKLLNPPEDPVAAQQRNDAQVRANADNAARSRDREERQQADEEGGAVEPGYSSESDRLYDDETKAAAARAKTGFERNYIVATRNRYRRDAWLIAARAEAAANQLRRTRDTRETFDALEEAAFWDPENIALYRTQREDLYASLSEEEKDEYADRSERLNEAYLRGLIRRNPKLALETLRSRRGAAAEDLGISDEMREELEHEAEREHIDEQQAFEREQQQKAGEAWIAAKGFTIRSDGDPSAPWLAFDPAIEVFELDPKVGRRIESVADGIARMSEEIAAEDLKIGRQLARGSIARFDELPARSLDRYSAAVVGEGEGAPPDVVRRRAAGFANVVGGVPNATRLRIVSGVRSDDIGTLAETGRLLRELERYRIPGGLDWAPHEVQSYWREFDALTSRLSLSDEDAARRIAKANKSPAAQREARHHHFDEILDAETISNVLNDAFGVEVQDLLYRPGKDAVKEVREPYRDDGSVRLVPLGHDDR